MLDIWAKTEDRDTINAAAKIPNALRRVILLDLCIIWIRLIKARQFLGTDNSLILATFGPNLRDRF
jgi:hypothetical protein